MGVNLPLSVNMAINALLQLPLAEIVGTRPGHWAGLIIDVTEEQVVTDLEAAIAMAAIGAAECAAGVDDFGAAIPL